MDASQLRQARIALFGVLGAHVAWLAMRTVRVLLFTLLGTTSTHDVDTIITIGWFTTTVSMLGTVAELGFVIAYASALRRTSVAGLARAAWLVLIAQRAAWYLPVFFLSGVVQNGRKVGFATAVLEMAPSLERPTYAALNSVLVLPVALLPLIAGVLLHVSSYHVVFVAAAVFIGAGACLARRWAQEQPPGSRSTTS